MDGIDLKAFLALPRARLETLPISLKSLGNILKFYDKFKGNVVTLVIRSLSSFCSVFVVFPVHIHLVLHMLFSSGSFGLVPSGAESGAASNFEAANMYEQMLGAVEDDVCLSIDAGQVFPLTSFEKDQKRGQNKVLARTCTRHLLEILVWMMKGNQFEGKSRKGVIITGPPGDGKVSAL